MFFSVKKKTLLIRSAVELVLCVCIMLFSGGVCFAADELEVIGLRFFETSPEEKEPVSRDYSDVFELSETRYIGTRIDMEKDAGSGANGPAEHLLVWKCFAPDGSLYSQLPVLVGTAPGRSVVTKEVSVGWDSPGRWVPGKYRVEILEKGQRKAFGSFEVN